MANENQASADLSAVADEVRIFSLSLASTDELITIPKQHARILHTISDYDSAPAELRDTKSLLESLEKDIKVREGRLKQLVKNRCVIVLPHQCSDKR